MTIDDVMKQISERGYGFVNLSYDPKINSEFLGLKYYRLLPEKFNDYEHQLQRHRFDKLVSNNGYALDSTLYCIMKVDNDSLNRLCATPEFEDFTYTLGFFDIPEAELNDIEGRKQNLQEVRGMFSKHHTIEEIKSEIIKCYTDPNNKGSHNQAIWTSLPLDSVEKRSIGDTTTYKIKIAGREMALTSMKLLDSKSFRAKFQDLFGVQLPFCRTELWSMFTLYINSLICTEVVRDTTSERDMIRENVKNHIEGSIAVPTYDEAMNSWNSIRIGEGDNLYIFPKHLLEGIKNQVGREINVNNVVDAIADWYITSTPRKLKDNKKQVRFWRLRKSAFDLSGIAQEEDDRQGALIESGEHE